LQSLLESNQGVRLHLLGYLELDSSWGPYSEKIVRTRFLPYDDYFQLLGKATLCLAPLEAENPFCRAKSELKFIEAAAWGVPVLATRAGAFAEAIEHGIDGFLAGDAAEQARVFEAIIQRPELARAAGAKARAKVLARYTTSARMQDVKAILQHTMN
jgi:glycosyltransferase involved in cell wall biosynthesis